MPSLFRYFVVVGSALLGLLLLVNHMAGPAPTPAAVTAAAAKPIVEHDPRASLIERWRDEQAARRAAERGEPAPQVAAAPSPVSAESTPIPVPPPVEPARDEPPQVVAPAALHTPANDVAPNIEASKVEKFKAVQARKARIARERARAKRQEEAASRQQDQFFYSQPRPAYAQGPTFNPFGFAQTR